jgi:hypothetical protein
MICSRYSWTVSRLFLEFTPLLIPRAMQNSPPKFLGIQNLLQSTRDYRPPAVERRWPVDYDFKTCVIAKKPSPACQRRHLRSPWNEKCHRWTHRIHAGSGNVDSVCAWKNIPMLADNMLPQQICDSPVYDFRAVLFSFCWRASFVNQGILSGSRHPTLCSSWACFSSFPSVSVPEYQVKTWAHTFTVYTNSLMGSCVVIPVWNLKKFIYQSWTGWTFVIDCVAWTKIKLRNLPRFRTSYVFQIRATVDTYANLLPVCGPWQPDEFWQVQLKNCRTS